jgi:dienelactone hydrolase
MLAAYHACMPEPEKLHSTLEQHGRFITLGQGVPALLVLPEPSHRPAPLLIWMHGRTADKTVDTGRYLRLFRAGIASCSLDLPGHGERYDEEGQKPESVLKIVEQMVDELDEVTTELAGRTEIDEHRIAIGGISAGGMVALARCCRPHAYEAITVEATTGNLEYRASSIFADPKRSRRLDPIAHLDHWRPIPLLALHNLLDEWIEIDGQRFFIEAVRKRHKNPDEVEFHVYEKPTGAPYEHSGFGKYSADAKARQVDFLSRVLSPKS